MENNQINKWLLFSLSMLVVVALCGLIMRTLPMVSFGGLNYEFLLHAHSHLAFLGWIYNALFAGIIRCFIPTDDQKTLSKYNTLFWITQAVTVWMFVAFLVDGYHTPAIIGLSIHTLLTYVFIAYLFSDTRRGQSGLSIFLLRIALITLLLSTLGPLAIPIIKANSINPDYIKLAVNYYLHFQYNGWFVFGVLAIVFKQLPTSLTTNRTLAIGVWLLLGIIPTYFLSIQWIGLWGWIKVLSTVAATVQFIGAVLIGYQFFHFKEQWQNRFGEGIGHWLLFGFSVLVVKCLFLLLSAAPVVYEWVFHNRNIMIAYLHWHFLGFVTLEILVLFGSANWLDPYLRLYRWGFRIFVFGFIIQETYLFAQPVLARLGISLAEIHLELLWFASMLLFVGTVVFLIACTRFLKRGSMD